MPTARQLLEQADALMRRNRKRGKDRPGDPPTLGAALGSGDTTIAPTLVLPDAAAADPIVLDAPNESPAVANVDVLSPANAAQPANDDPMSLDTLADVPVLTDVVVAGRPLVEEGGGFVPYAISSTPLPVAFAERALQTPASAPAVREGDALREGDAFPASAEEAKAAAAQLPAPAVIEQEASAVLTASAESPAAPSPAPGTSSPVSSSASPAADDEFILEIPPAPDTPKTMLPDESPIPPVPAPELPGDREWGALAEELRMQVLQRLDLLTDTGLRDQLGACLQPIVDRASAQLIETINRELGELVRGYVAQAIEREIESWRKSKS